MKRPPIPIIAIAILACFSSALSCKKQELSSATDESRKLQTYEVTGQVFAIQRNRVNVKLGDVPIHYVDGPTFDARLSWIAGNLNRARAAYDYENKLKLIEEMSHEQADRNLDYEKQEALQSMSLFAKNARSRIRDAPTVAGFLTINDHAKTNYLSGKNNLEFDFDSWFVASLFGDWLGKHAYAVTGTDADGNYRINLPVESHGYLLAKASREMIDSEVEVYHWIYEVNGTITTPVNLTTNNLLDGQQIGVFADKFRGMSSYTVETLVHENGLLEVDWVVEARRIFSEVDLLKRQVSANRESVAELRSKIEEIK